MAGAGNESVMQAYYDRYGVMPLAWTAAGRPVFPGWLSSMFVHVGLWHLVANAFWVWVFGRQYGWWVVPMYLWGGALAGAAYVMWQPYGQTPVVGASGAVAALAGGLVAARWLPVEELLIYRWRIPGNFLLGAFAAMLALDVFGLRDLADGARPDALATVGVHLAGAVSGLAGGWALGRIKRKAA